MKTIWSITVCMVAVLVFAACDMPLGGFPTRTYTITFDSNGGDTEASPTVKTVTNRAATVDELPIPPAKSGYAFNGWNTAADGSGLPFTTETATRENITVYARWVVIASNSFMVTFNSNGGDTEANPATKTVAPGGAVKTLPAEPTREGWDFKGWNVYPNGSGTPFFASTTVKNDITVYAQWKEILPGPFTVTFNADGGEPVPPNLPEVKHGEKITEPQTMSKDGYTFSGWYKEEGFTNRWYFDTDTVTQDTTLYARWATVVYTVTYDGNGSNGGEVPVDNNFYENGDEVTVLGNTGNLFKTGYKFDGWNTASNGGGTTYAANATFNVETTNVILYAKWNITITFNADGGSPAPASQTIAIGGTVTEPATMTKTGYTFDGWYKESTLTNAWTFASDIAATSITLYAKWNIAQYSVTFNANGGSPAPNTVLVNWGGTVSAPPAMTKSDSFFSGWYKEAAYANLWNFASDTISGTTTLYAKWQTLAAINDLEFGAGATIQTISVSNVTEWNNAKSTIAGGGDGKKYIINISAGFGVGGSTASTFGSAKNIVVSIRKIASNGTKPVLSLTSSGMLLYIRENQTVFLRDVDLHGWTDNKSTSLVFIGNGTFGMKGSSVVSRNTATSGDGGGVRVSGGIFTMWDNAVVSGNTASSGGGVNVSSGTFTMRDNAKVSGNSSGYGGGVCVNGTLIMRDNATISGNTASGSGGGVYIGNTWYGGPFKIAGGIVYGSAAGENSNTSGGSGAALYAYWSDVAARGTFTGDTWNELGILTSPINYTLKVVNGVLQ